MAIEYSNTFEDRLETAIEKADQIENENESEQRVASATDSVRGLGFTLENVENTAKELSFHVSVLEDVFGGTRKNCTSFDFDLEAASRKANIDDDKVIDAAEEISFAKLESKVSDANKHLNQAIDAVQDQIEDEHVDPYLKDLASAKELNSIIGGDNDEFGRHIETMESFLHAEIRDTEESISMLSANWENLEGQWREHEDKQGWTQFQREHDLSNETIDELKQFTNKDAVKLSDLTIETLEEIKDVPELESALEVRLQT